MNPKHIVAGYFVIQSFATLAWWVLLFAYPPSTKWFQPIDWPTATLHSFWLADAIVIVGGSFVAAVSVLRDYRHRHLIVWSVAVSTVYPTLFCIATSQLSGEAWVAASLMSALSGMSLAMATIHGMKDQTSATTRVAEMNGLKSVGWTLLQTIFFWGIFLWVFPKGLMEIQAHLSLAFFHHRYQETGSFLLFAFASMIGLMSGLTMATRGSGTPLPTATASQLVVVGPYQFVRNPMAVAGILQGIAVGWFYGSVLVIVYSLIGAVLWHLFVRPIEETDLENRFGESYASYKSTVGLWLPRITSQDLPKQR